MYGKECKKETRKRNKKETKKTFKTTTYNIFIGFMCDMFYCIYLYK